MPLRKASAQRPTASAVRSQAPTSPPVSQAPPATAAGMERSDNRPPTDFANAISEESRQGAAGVLAGPPKRQKIEESITFTEEDAQGVQFSHNDVVVVSLNIANYDVRRILVDNGSSADILFYDAFSRCQSGIPKSEYDQMAVVELSGCRGRADDAVTASMDNRDACKQQADQREARGEGRLLGK